MSGTFASFDTALSALRYNRITMDVASDDVAKAVVDLQMQEVAYQAALGATARVLQPSLLDFLR